MTKHPDGSNRSRRESISNLIGAGSLAVKPIDGRHRTEKALQVECNNFEAVLDALSNGAYIINRQYAIEYTNHLIINEFGPVDGRKCHEYFNERGEICPWCKIDKVLSGKTVDWHWHCYKNGKSYQLIETPIISFRRVVSKLTILHDMTDFEKTEMALHESENQLRHVSFQLLSAQEAERRRISRELHDELGGALAVLKLRTSSIEKSLQPEQTTLRQECKQNMLFIDQIIENVHRLSRDLSPSILEDLGLTTALRWQVDNFIRYHGINVVMDIETVDHLVSKETHIMLYRILQEVFTNIGKHAHAENVTVFLKRGPDQISLRVEDDGKGFNVNSILSRTLSETGMGLETMRERTQMMNGHFQLSTEPGKGTLISISIPITKENKP